MPPNPKNFNVDNVRVVKIMGGSLSGSKVVQGMVFGREPEGTIKKALRAKVAVYTCGIDISQTETKGTVLIKNADEMLNFTTGEEKHMEKVIEPSLRKRMLLNVSFCRYSRKLLTPVSKSSSVDQLLATLLFTTSIVLTSQSSKSCQNSSFVGCVGSSMLHR